MTRRWSVAFALLFLSASVFAQEGDNKHVIAVSVDSTDFRIQGKLPELRELAVKEVESSAKNVSASIVIGSPSGVAEQARQKSADYLLTIDLSLLRQVSVPSKVGLGNGPATTADVPVVGGVPSGVAHSRCEDLLGEAFMFSYTVTSLAEEKFKLHDSHTIQEYEYPLGPELDCLAKFSTRAVRESASAAVKKLKSKKRL